MKTRLLSFLRRLLGPEPRPWLQSPHKDAICLRPVVVLNPADNSITVVDFETKRPIQFVGELTAATWEFGSNGTVGAVRATLVNPAVYTLQQPVQ